MGDVPLTNCRVSWLRRPQRAWDAPEKEEESVKKLMVLAAMLAMMLAIASPAFAQDVTVTTGNNTEYNALCQNLIGSVGNVSATQTGVAAAGNESTLNDSAAVATVSQSQNVFLVQSNACLNNLFWWWWF